MSKFNSIKPPENIDEVTKNSIQKGKNYMNRKKYKQIIASSLLIGVGIVGVGIINPSLADGVPVIEQIFQDLNENLGIDDIFSKYAQEIGQSQTVDGVSVSVDEVVSDGHNLYITYKIKSDKKLPRSDYKPYGEPSGDFMMYSDIKIDNNGEMAGGTSLSGYYKDDYTFVGMESYKIEFKGNEAPEKFNVKIKINNIGDVYMSEDEMIKGPFKFSLDIKNKADVNVVNINQSIDNFKINTVEVSPYSININYQFPKSFVSNKVDLIKSLIVEDESGNELAFHSYDDDTIIANNLRVENNIVHDTALINYKEMGYKEAPKYLVVKFKDFTQSQEKGNIYTSADGNITEYTLPEPQEIKETKDIEFRLNLNK